MKKLLSICFSALLITSVSIAQSKKDTLNSKNLVKINLSSLALNNYSFQYERKIGKRVSVAIGYRFMPESSVPFKSQIIDQLGEEDPELTNSIEGFKTSNFAFTPELRWYISRKGAPRGFYLAPFARFAEYTAKIPFEFEVNNGATSYKKTIDLSGNVKTTTGGLLLGSQFKLSKLVYLDLWLLGPNYGSSDGGIDGKPNVPFTALEQQELKDALNDLDIPLTDKEVTVTANSANVKLSGPWAGIRGLGFNLAFRF